MTKKRTVVLYGNSLILSGIAASLESEPRLVLHQLPADPHQVEEHVARLAPDIILFDLAVPHPDWTVILASHHPGPVLIGVMPDNGDMLQITGQRRHAVTRKDLVRILNLAAPLRWVERITRFVAGSIAFTARHRLVPAFLVLGACATIAFLALSANRSLPLSGAATGTGATDPWVFFAAGGILSGMAIGAWTLIQRRLR